MYVLINECSFIGQAQSQDEASILMKQMLSIVRELKDIEIGSPICIHNQIHEKYITSNITTHEWAVFKKNNDSYRDLRIFWDILMKKGPFINELLDESVPSHICFFQENDVTGSSLAGAAHFQGIVVSLAKHNQFQNQEITVFFQINPSEKHPKIITNLWVQEHIWLIRKRYEPNPKHDIKIPNHGVHGSIMDLPDDIAQRVLDKGVIYGKKFYGYYQGKYYTFTPHRENFYHGFPINELDVPTPVIKQMRDTGIIPKKT